MNAASSPSRPHPRPRPQRRQRGRSGVLIAAVVMLSGCADPVAGAPQGAAGFGPESSSARPAPPHRLDEADTCTLLVPPDLERLGGVGGEPRRNALLPQSCSYDLAGGAAGDTAALAWYKPLDQARAQAPAGALVQTAGYPTWVGCGVDDGYQSCSAAVAVRPDRTLLVLLSRRDVSEVSVRADLEALTRTALSRLPEQ